MTRPVSYNNDPVDCIIDYNENVRSKLDSGKVKIDAVNFARKNNSFCNRNPRYGQKNISGWMAKLTEGTGGQCKVISYR